MVKPHFCFVLLADGKKIHESLRDYTVCEQMKRESVLNIWLNQHPEKLQLMIPLLRSRIY